MLMSLLLVTKSNITEYFSFRFSLLRSLHRCTNCILRWNLYRESADKFYLSNTNSYKKTKRKIYLKLLEEDRRLIIVHETKNTKQKDLWWIIWRKFPFESFLFVFVIFFEDFSEYSEKNDVNSKSGGQCSRRIGSRQTKEQIPWNLNTFFQSGFYVCFSMNFLV